MTDALYKSNYSLFFQSLAEVETAYLLPNPWLAPHARYYIREMRIKAYSQLLESYRSLTLERMCRSFGVSESYMDRDLSRFIASGRLACTIDKVSGVVMTNKLASQNKTVVYEQVVKQGDSLLSGKLAQILGSTDRRHTKIASSCGMRFGKCIAYTAFMHVTEECDLFSFEYHQTARAA